MSFPDNELLVSVLSQLSVERGPDKRGNYVCWCSFHPDGQGKAPHRPNLHVSEHGFICHACGEKGSLAGLAKRLGMEITATVTSLEMTYDYKDASGQLLFQVVRKPGKRFLQRQPNGNGGWIWKMDGVARVPYRLPDLLAHPDKTVFIPEGEKDADRLFREGLLATTNPGGANKWKDEYSQHLRDRDVVILPDNDESGRRHGEQVTSSLTGIARSVKLLTLPDLPDKGDVSDWMNAGHTVAELQLRADQASIVQSSGVDAPPFASEDEEGGAQADRLIRLAKEAGIGLFHDPQGDCYASVPIGEHREIWPLDSKDCKRWLAGLFWRSEQKAPRAEAVSGCRLVLESEAWFDGPEHELHNRVARHEDAFWYDLADEGWRAVRITSVGWSIVPDPPILFRRYAHQCAQVEPERGGNLWSFVDFLNVSDEGQRLLIVVYLVSCLLPEIAHPVPVLHGPQGAAKTTLLRLLRRLADPSIVETLAPPRDFKELVQQLSHHWAAFYDNLTVIPDWLSDAFCRAVTGEGASKRQLFTDDDDVIYRFRRCVGLNGINVAAHKADLLDRAILIGLDDISEERRRPEEAFWRDFEDQRPKLFGAALDVLSRAMKVEPKIELPRHPRMADFARWGCAIAEAIGRSASEFLMAYEANIRTRNDEVIAGTPVAAAVVAFMEDRLEWEGTATELLAGLQTVAEEARINQKSRAWPKGAQALTRRLNEVRTNLNAAGIRVDMGRGRTRKIQLAKRSDVKERSGDYANPQGDDMCAVLDHIPSSPEPAPRGLLDGIDGIDGIFPSPGPRGDYDF